jgi:type 1 glutamine amidotransferase
MRCCWNALALATVLGVCAAPGTAAEPATKIRVLLTFGGHGFDQPAFFAMFDAMRDVQYTKAEFPRQLDLLKPGLERQYDVLVMYDLNPKITPEQQKNFQALLERGIGLVSLHHNLAAHRQWPAYRQVIGGQFLLAPTEIDGRQWAKSTWDHDQTVPVTIVDREHPITRGLADFTIIDETYGNYYVAPGVHVLLKTNHPKNTPELAWTTKYAASPVVFLMLGHDAKAYGNPSYRELVARSIRFVAGK